MSIDKDAQRFTLLDVIARVERDRVLAMLDAAKSDWDRDVIDHTIRVFAGFGTPFSANDIRPWIPEVRKSLIGARFMAAARRAEILRIGYVQSSDPQTHAHPIGLWQGVPAGRPEAVHVLEERGR